MDREEHNPFRLLSKADLYDSLRGADCACGQADVIRELLRRYDRQQTKAKSNRPFRTNR
jgi:hypothetical protein